jgi:hypothetical protein
VSFWRRHPRDQDMGSPCMKSELYVLVLRDDPSYHLGPCHLWKWFLHALEHEQNASFAPLNLLWLHPFCPCFPAKTQYFQMHIRSWTCYIISVPSGELVANHNWNQCITSTLGWRKFTVNTKQTVCETSTDQQQLGKRIETKVLKHTWRTRRTTDWTVPRGQSARWPRTVRRARRQQNELDLLKVNTTFPLPDLPNQPRDCYQIMKRL